LTVFVVLYGIAYWSADLAIKTQYLILGIIVVSLGSVGLAAWNGSMIYDVADVSLWGTYRGAPEDGFSGSSFWIVFAVFFPAATGIMAGANMSGDLKDPRGSIPKGTLWAIGVSLVVYLVLAYWIAGSATVDELTSNYNVMIEKAFYGPAVLAGLLGATFSSALASMVGAARILQAMGEHRILPGSPWLAVKNNAGDPRNAMIVTGGIVLLTLLLRDLNAIAPLVTMFFLITYAMINVVILIEQQLDLTSFRPLLRVPVVVPVLGLTGSLFAMFIINPTVSLVAVGVVVAFYFVLTRRRIEAQFEDVRSGLFVSFAEWAAKKAVVLPTRQERAWKPNLLVPIENVQQLRGEYQLLHSVAMPNASILVFGICLDGKLSEQSHEIDSTTNAFRRDGVFSSSAVVRAGGYVEGLTAGMQALQSAFFKPNVLVLRRPESDERTQDYLRIIDEASAIQMGVMLYAPHPVAGLGQQQTVNVWIRDRSPDWNLRWNIGNLDLSILLAYKLKRNWNARLRLITVVDDPDNMEHARDFMRRLVDLARLPRTEVVVVTGAFFDYLPTAPYADVNVFGFDVNPNFEVIDRLVETTGSTCLFVRDSGYESALA
ncbi:MAG: amino acid permease, partial [Bacteroidota bacterium]